MNLVVSLNKPKGISSNDALIQTKKLFKVKKAGHAGTLDPIAEGVLLIGLNEATKVLPYLMGLEKGYFFTARLGITTDTYDAEGKVVKEADIGGLSEDLIKMKIREFTGTIQQRPPLYSAIKLKGKPMYEYARKGVEVEIPARTVKIYRLELVEYSPPFASFLVDCSSGTYIRSLCHDLGIALGTGAHVTVLRRTRIGPFSLEGSAVLEKLPLTKKGIYTIDDALSFMPSVTLNPRLTKMARQGMSIELDKLLDLHEIRIEQSNYKVYSERSIRLVDDTNHTFAIAEIIKGKIKVKRVLNL